MRVRGRALARPAIIREKNTPIDSEVPEFWKVARIPEATPRYWAGTLDMIEEEFGELCTSRSPPAAAAYTRDQHGNYQPYGICVLTVAGRGIRQIRSFADPSLVTLFEAWLDPPRQREFAGRLRRPEAAGRMSR